MFISRYTTLDSCCSQVLGCLGICSPAEQFNELHKNKSGYSKFLIYARAKNQPRPETSWTTKRTSSGGYVYVAALYNFTYIVFGRNSSLYALWHGNRLDIRFIFIFFVPSSRSQVSCGAYCIHFQFKCSPEL